MLTGPQQRQLESAWPKEENLFNDLRRAAQNGGRVNEITLDRGAVMTDAPAPSHKPGTKDNFGPATCGYSETRKLLKTLAQCKSIQIRQPRQSFKGQLPRPRRMPSPSKAQEN